MSALIIDYSELQTIATNATSLASKAENYCNELNSTVYSAFGSVTAGVNDLNNLREIVGKHVYNKDVEKDGQVFTELIIE